MPPCSAEMLGVRVCWGTGACPVGVGLPEDEEKKRCIPPWLPLSLLPLLPELPLLCGVLVPLFFVALFWAAKLKRNNDLLKRKFL